jgi:uncharacterized protein (DUF486 family)
MLKYCLPIGLLAVANVFMTLAWYGHLKLKDWGWLQQPHWTLLVLLSWGMALFEYCFQVPANRMGYIEQGGPYTLLQLKMIQEVLSLSIFTVFVVVFFKGESLKINHLWGFLCLLGAVYFFFKK